MSPPILFCARSSRWEDFADSEDSVTELPEDALQPSITGSVGIDRAHAEGLLHRGVVRAPAWRADRL